MHNKLLYLFLFFIVSVIFACQNDKTTPKSTQQATATTPKVATYQGKGKMMKVATMSGIDGNAYVVAPKRRDKNVLFVFPDHNGLDNFTMQQADWFFDQLTQENILVFALDIYDGQTFATIAEATQWQKENINRIRDIIIGARGFAGSHAKIASVGWGSGADIALEATILCQHQGSGAVLFDGVTPKNAVDLGRLKAPVLAFFGNQSTRMNAEDIANFEANCKITRNQLILRQYDVKAGYYYNNTSAYNAEAAQKSESITLDFLAQCF